jgi:hypothetical protein
MYNLGIERLKTLQSLRRLLDSLLIDVGDSQDLWLQNNRSLDGVYDFSSLKPFLHVLMIWLVKAIIIWICCDYRLNSGLHTFIKLT